MPYIFGMLRTCPLINKMNIQGKNENSAKIDPN
jgi:hypothetical protein